jgi:hypothetical protein
VVKWNCVFRGQDNAGLAPSDYSYRMLVAIGTLAEVEAMLGEWTKSGAQGSSRLKRHDLPDRGEREEEAPQVRDQRVRLVEAHPGRARQSVIRPRPARRS